MTNQVYLAFDTETGGLNPKSADLLTFYGAILDENFKILEELDLKLKPNDGRLPIAEAAALNKNGINIQNHLADPSTITYREAAAQILAMLRRHLQKKGRYSNIRPLGQNVQFDIDWVQEHLVSKDEWNSIVHYAKIDTKLCVDFLKDSNWFPSDLSGLGTVVEYLQLSKRNAHNAKEDTLMCVDVYKKLLELMRSKKDGGGSTQDLISLLEAE
jgi:DNA polymerase III epsilon subunit-like protein